MLRPGRQMPPGCSRGTSSIRASAGLPGFRGNLDFNPAWDPLACFGLAAVSWVLAGRSPQSSGCSGQSVRSLRPRSRAALAVSDHCPVLDLLRRLSRARGKRCSIRCREARPAARHGQVPAPRPINFYSVAAPINLACRSLSTPRRWRTRPTMPGRSHCTGLAAIRKCQLCAKSRHSDRR